MRGVAHSVIVWNCRRRNVSSEETYEGWSALKALVQISLLALTLSSSAAVLAQTEIVPDGDISGSSDEDIVGWNPSLAVSGSFNLVDNSNVVGQVEGSSMLVGFGAIGGADYINGKSVVRLELTINEGFAKTPVVDRFLKTNDELAVSSTYNYFLTKVMGGFGRAKVSTSLFTARAITADPETYTILPSGIGGTPENVTSSELKVASAFKPFTLTESIGAFAQPITGKDLTLRLRGGVGGRHTFASDVFVQNDDDTTPAIEMQELSNVHQAGLELFAGIEGKVQEDRVSYALGASALLPVLNNDDFDRSATDLARLAIEASATVSVFEWMGLTYKGSIIRDPQLFPDGEELTQFQNSFLLTFNYTLIDRVRGVKALEAEKAAADEKKAKEEAEKRATEAEEKAKALELELEEAKRREEEAKKAPPPVPVPATQPSDGTAPSAGTTDGTGTTTTP